MVYPSDPQDALGLLISSIRDDNPVAFIEHKMLYSVKGEVSDENEPIPLGLTAVKRKGEDATS
nr:hypothetical protein [Biomaibacter acetigenes]